MGPVVYTPGLFELLRPPCTLRRARTRSGLHLLDVVTLHHGLASAHAGHEVQKLRILKLWIRVSRQRLRDATRVRRRLRLRLRGHVGNTCLRRLLLLPELIRPLPAGHVPVKLLRPGIRGRVRRVRLDRSDLGVKFIRARARSPPPAVFLRPLHVLRSSALEPCTNVRVRLGVALRERHPGEVVGPSTRVLRGLRLRPMIAPVLVDPPGS